jgi:quercetin dioxygenase-like cupin family protein
MPACSTIGPQEKAMPLRRPAARRPALPAQGPPFALALCLACAGGALLHAPLAAAHEAVEETASLKFTQALPNAPGKSFSTLVVDFPPGARARPHRHGQAFVYAYVLKGAVRSALDDGPPSTYRAGDNWFEPPGARHPLTENASRTQAARLLVVFVANTGDALKTPDQP